jgi:hypothetical protein
MEFGACVAGSITGRELLELLSKPSERMAQSCTLKVNIYPQQKLTIA